MIFIANRTLETADRLYQPGDAIPDFLNWNEQARRAHLSQGNVERSSEPLGDRPTGRLKADIDREHQEEEALARNLYEAAASLDDPESAGTGDRTIAGEEKGEDGQDLEALREGGMLTCPACEGFIVGTEEGMRKHLDKAHGGQIPAPRRKSKASDKEFAKLAPPPSPSARHIKGKSLVEAATARPSDDE